MCCALWSFGCTADNSGTSAFDASPANGEDASNVADATEVADASIVVPDAAAADVVSGDAEIEDSGFVDVGVLDAGFLDAEAQDAIPVDTGIPPGPPPLLSRNGCFFEVMTPGQMRNLPFGTVGTRYNRLRVRFDLETGMWREDLYDREVLNHIVFGLFRNSRVSRERYILGLAAQIRPARANLDPVSVFFARVDLDPRPMGQGFMSYQSFRRGFGWQTNQTYNVDVLLDAVAQRQTLVLSRNGNVVLMHGGAIDYFGPELTESGWYIQLGAPETEHRDVSPVGWRICNLTVVSER